MRTALKFLQILVSRTPVSIGAGMTFNGVELTFDGTPLTYNS